MNKILIGGAIIITTTLANNAHAVELELVCANKEETYACPLIVENATMDTTTCKNICSTCSGNITLPTGYVSSTGSTTVTKIVSIGCPELSGLKYVKKCSCTTQQTVSCDTTNGYSGSVTFDGTNFSGCTKGGGIIIGPVLKTCNQGEYMNGTTCTACPSFNGIAGTTALMGQKKITDCYIPSGNTFADDTGTYTLTDNCYYTE